MRRFKTVLSILFIGASALILSGCVNVDEAVLDTSIDYGVNINMPYTTTTPLPNASETVDQVVIDPNGGVTVNDASLLIGSQSLTNEEQNGYSTLKLGDANQQVTDLQTRLTDLRYMDSGVSGIFDAETEAAVKRFEQTYGVMQTGIATPSFQQHLYADDAPLYASEAYDAAVTSQYTTLQRGAIGSSVYALQHRLKELGYPIRELTGVYDEETEAAVSLFAQSYGLQDQTIAYIALQKELYSDGAKPYSETEEGIQTASENTLVPGNIGTQVMKMQNRLIELKYLVSGSATGVYDAETEAAVREFEDACSLQPTGEMSPTVQALLLSANAPEKGQTVASDGTIYTDLFPGDEGETVLKIQNRLIELGYANGAGNGVYGEETQTALSFFQHYNGLEENGIATSGVQVYLFSDDAISYEDALSGVLPPTPTPMITLAPEPTLGPMSDSVTDDQTLRYGDKSSAVKTMQKRLKKLGYTTSTKGKFDDKTRKAVMAFQANVGVPQTGEATLELQKYLMSKAAPANKYRLFNSTQNFTNLLYGSAGDSVKLLQQQLWTLGYLTTEDVEIANGIFDEKTRDAVISAQLAMGYTEPDGIASAEFQCFIFSDYNNYIKK